MKVTPPAGVRQLVTDLLARARGGSAGVLVVRGDPGIGKTTLCADAVAMAGDMRVLRTTAVQAEASLPFAAGADLLHRTRPVWDRLGPALRTSLGAAVDGAEEPADAFALCNATLGALAATAADTPLLVVVDDAHWLDPASATALVYAARRIDADRIAVLFTARTTERSPTDGVGFNEVELGGVSEQQAADILRSAGAAPVATVVQQLVRGTHGNPLAMIECARLLSNAQQQGVEPLPDPLPVGALLEAAFLKKVSALPPSTATALLVAAASAAGRVAEISRALVEMESSAADLVPAEREGLITIVDGQIRFWHPIARAAAYHAATAEARRRAHVALSHVLPDPCESACHLELATVEPDAAVVTRLTDAAQRASARGAPAMAARLWRRAADLTVDTSQRAGCVLAAAVASAEAGLFSATDALAREGLALTDDSDVRAALIGIVSFATTLAGDPLAAHQLMTEEARRLQNDAPAAAARLLADAAWCVAGAARVATAMEDAGEAVALSTQADDTTKALCQAALGAVEVMHGNVSAGLDRLLTREETLARVANPFYPFIPWALAIGERFDAATELLDVLTARARAAAAPGLVAYALGVASDVAFRLGRWDEAYADATEAHQLAAVTGQEGTRLFAAGFLARLEAVTGLDDLCRARVDDTLPRAANRVDAITDFCHLAIGLLELGRSRPEAAVKSLLACKDLDERYGPIDLVLVSWYADLVEALAACGRREDAQQLVHETSHRLSADPRNVMRALHHRVQALLSHDEGAEKHFAAALEWHGRTPVPFERARTQLLLGEHRRRRGQRREARDPLTAARDTFVALGAAPWVGRAERELAATGARLAPRTLQPSASLTPQEMQVARQVARGLTNDEVAAALFLSAKTIEAHLGRAYRKLGVRNRVELAASLTTATS